MGEDLARLIGKIERLTPAQQRRIEGMVDAVAAPATFDVHPDSDFATAAFGDMFGEILRMHHSVSTENFTKDKFEHAFADVLNVLGHNAVLAPRGNPGHDLTLDGVPVSLKTQGNAAIKPDYIWISKFMELGKGAWETEEHLAGLREQMFRHMDNYDRIITLRSLTPGKNVPVRRYELVEIPKALLLSAADFPCVMKHDSPQNPKPGECVVTGALGRVLFTLYFDGGTERKLQVKDLAKSECIVHASWEFKVGA